MHHKLLETVSIELRGRHRDSALLGVESFTPALDFLGKVVLREIIDNTDVQDLATVLESMFTRKDLKQVVILCLFFRVFSFIIFFST